MTQTVTKLFKRFHLYKIAKLDLAVNSFDLVWFAILKKITFCSKMYKVFESLNIIIFVCFPSFCFNFVVVTSGFLLFSIAKCSWILIYEYSVVAWIIYKRCLGRYYIGISFTYIYFSYIDVNVEMFYSRDFWESSLFIMQPALHQKTKNFFFRFGAIVAQFRRCIIVIACYIKIIHR